MAVLETAAVDVIIKDQDDLLEDDLIGVACTSVQIAAVALLRDGSRDGDRVLQRRGRECDWGAGWAFPRLGRADGRRA